MSDFLTDEVMAEVYAWDMAHAKKPEERHVIAEGLAANIGKRLAHPMTERAFEAGRKAGAADASLGDLGAEIKADRERWSAMLSDLADITGMPRGGIVDHVRGMQVEVAALRDFQEKIRHAVYGIGGLCSIPWVEPGGTVAPPFPTATASSAIIPGTLTANTDGSAPTEPKPAVYYAAAWKDEEHAANATIVHNLRMLMPWQGESCVVGDCAYTYERAMAILVVAARNTLSVGMKCDEVRALCLGTENHPDNHDCDACKLYESITCQCGAPLFDHETGPGAPNEDTNCTGFVLATWLGQNPVAPSGAAAAKTITIGTPPASDVKLGTSLGPQLDVCLCGAVLTPENSAQPPGNPRKHIACPKAPGGAEAQIIANREPERMPEQGAGYGAVPMFYDIPWTKGLSACVRAADAWARENRQQPWNYPDASDAFKALRVKCDATRLAWFAVMIKAEEFDKALPVEIAPKPKEQLVVPGVEPPAEPQKGIPLPAKWSPDGESLALLTKMGLDIAKAIEDYRAAMVGQLAGRWTQGRFRNWIEGRAKAAAK